MAEDLEVDLAIARKFAVVDPLGQPVQVPLEAFGGSCPRLRRDVVELVIKPMLPQPRGHRRLGSERLVEVRPEVGIQARIFLLALVVTLASDRTRGCDAQT